MRSTFKLLFYINRNKVKSDGTTAVLCRISIDGKEIGSHDRRLLQTRGLGQQEV